MPEAAIDEDRDARWPEDDVDSTATIIEYRPVDSESEPPGM